MIDCSSHLCTRIELRSGKCVEYDMLEGGGTANNFVKFDRAGDGAANCVTKIVSVRKQISLRDVKID